MSGVTGDSKIKFMSDSKTNVSKSIGWMAGMGDRTGRYAMIIEKDGTISYAEIEESPREVSVSIPFPLDDGSSLTLTRFPGQKLFCLDFRHLL